MAKKSNVYWPERQEQLLNQLEKDDYQLMQKLDQVYRKEADEISKQIAGFMATYGEDNVIQYNKMFLALDESDRLLLIERMNDFARKYPEYSHLMSVRESIYKLNRLQGLQQSIYTQQMEIGAIEQEELTKYLEEVYKTGNQSVLEFLGHGTTMSGYNKDLFIRTINAKWVNEENFSDRIWSNREKLSGYINEDLRTAFARGDNSQTILKHMKERFPDAERANMARLIRTEGTYVFNEAQAQTWENSGVTEYVYSAVLDRRTSKICEGLDGQVFKWADREPGVNFPPMHPNCRSTYMLPDLDEEWLMSEMRRKNPGMFEDGSVASQATNTSQKPSIITNKPNSNMYKGIGKDHYEETHRILENSPDNIQNLWETFEEDMVMVDSKYRGHAHFNPLSGVHMDIDSSSLGSSWEKPYGTFFHEFGHNIDYLGNVKAGNGSRIEAISVNYNGGIFKKTIDSEVKEIISNFERSIKDDFKKYAGDFATLHQKGYISDYSYNWYTQHGNWLGSPPKYSKSLAYKAFERELKSIPIMDRSDISDIMEGATRMKVQGGIGHGASYWKTPDKLPKEAFAEMFNATTNNPGSLDVLKKYLPKSYEIFEEIVDLLIAP